MQAGFGKGRAIRAQARDDARAGRRRGGEGGACGQRGGGGSGPVHKGRGDQFKRELLVLLLEHWLNGGLLGHPRASRLDAHSCHHA
eukprot:5101444-Pleurochrysis_carterae.AAC.1